MSFPKNILHRCQYSHDADNNSDFYVIYFTLCKGNSQVQRMGLFCLCLKSTSPLPPPSPSSSLILPSRPVIPAHFFYFSCILHLFLHLHLKLSSSNITYVPFTSSSSLCLSAPVFPAFVVLSVLRSWCLKADAASLRRQAPARPAIWCVETENYCRTL